MPQSSHILFISSWYPNRYNPTHGIFNLYFAQAAALYNKVTVLHVCSDETLNKPFEVVNAVYEGINMITVYYQKVKNGLPFLTQIKKRKRLLSAFDIGYKFLEDTFGKPDLMHLNVAMPAGIGVLHLSKKHQLSFVLNENWSGYCAEDGNYQGYFLKYFTEKIVAQAKTIMPTSDFLAKAMKQHKLNGNYVVVPNVVNVAKFRPIETSQHEGLRLLHVSSLNDREKNISGMLRAFSKALKRNKDLFLEIVGDSEFKPGFENLTKELGITAHVKFTGRLMSDDLVRAINNCDSLIMFSHYETFSLVIIEAFACGKPVIASNAGAIADYMRPDFGMMVDKGDEIQLENAIVKMAELKNKFNGTIIRDFAVSNFSYEKVGEALTRIYQKALSEGATSFNKSANITVS